MKVVSAEGMRKIDATAIENFKIPGLSLMENAGSAIARESISLLQNKLEDKRIVVICGKGNNGGDGFVAARHLLHHKASIEVYCTAPDRVYKGDAHMNLKILKKCGHKVKTITSSKHLQAIEGNPDLIIDALLGTGTRGTVIGFSSELIEWMNRQRSLRLAVDIPSGMLANTGKLNGPCVKADLTVTMGLLKTGMVFSDAREYVGKCSVQNIGFPPALLTNTRYANLVLPEHLRELLPARPKTAHKSNMGKVLFFAGSRGMSGAAALGSLAALKSGAGLVVLACPESLCDAMTKKLTEVMILPLPEKEGFLDVKAAAKLLKKKLNWANAIAIGPGLGRSDAVKVLVRELLLSAHQNIVLDADGLNAIDQKFIKSRKKSSELILTPHTGEYVRLFKSLPENTGEEQLQAVVKNAKAHKVHIHLKGAPSFSVPTDGSVYINSTGNEGMATAGSGDVLSGILSGLLAQGLSPTDSLQLGPWLHGYAGDLAREKKGSHSLVASDLIAHLPSAFKALSHGKTEAHHALFQV